MAGAVEELLRYTSPTQYMARTTTRPVELHHTTIPARRCCSSSARATATLASSTSPTSSTCTAPTRILALGHGAHVCLGAAVVRLEARVALEEFLARCEYDVDESGVEYMHSGNVQGPSSVPVRVPVAVG